MKSDNQVMCFNQKSKMLLLLKIFMEETDSEHGLTLEEIIKKLEQYGVNLERKTVQDDMKYLDLFNDSISIENYRDENDKRIIRYYLAGRTLELAELKLLTSSIQAARFITNKQSNDLIAKLSTLLSEHEGKALKKQTIVASKVKTTNKSVFYTIDVLNQAIEEHKKIQFKYLQWNLDKELVERKDGQWYETSPWALLWKDEKYYLLGWDSTHSNFINYRVDKIMDVTLLDDIRDGEKVKLEDYVNNRFGMFNGEEKRVTFEVNNRHIGIFIDYFGKDIRIEKLKDREWFRTTVKVVPNDIFLGWVIALGNDVKIIAPDDVKQKMITIIQRLRKQYDVCVNIETRTKVNIF